MTGDITKSCSPQKRYWQIFCDLLGMNRMASVCLLSYTVTIPDGEIFKVNSDTFIQCLSMPRNPVGNVLIIKGGAQHTSPDTYYIRIAAMLLGKSTRMFLFEKNCPVLNFEFSADIADALTFIKYNFSGPTTVIGYSMGGSLLLSYLAEGYDQADLYIPACCALDLNDFMETLSNNWFFNFMLKCQFEIYDVSDKEELLKLSGTTSKRTQKYMNRFQHKLNSTIDKWVSKTVYVIGSDDPISQNYSKWLRRLKRPLLTYVVAGGWHCCLNTIYLTCELVLNYLECLSRGEKIPIKDIICR